MTDAKRLANSVTVSWQTTAVCLYLRATRKRRYRTAKAGLRRLADGVPAAPPPSSLRGRISSEVVGGCEVYVVRPPAAATELGALVYFHGGAFVNGIAKQHWDLVTALCDATGRPVFVPLYPLAPLHRAVDARTFLEALYERVRPSAPLHLLGDSAGGNLALLLAQGHQDDPAIVGLTLIAPWLDISIGNPEVDAVEPRDPWLTRAGLRPIARQWAGEYALDDPDISPLFGDLTQLPTTAVFVGSRDICLPDCQRLEQLAAPSGALTLHVQEGSPHVYPLLPTPEGRAAQEQIVQHVVTSLSSR